MSKKILFYDIETTGLDSKKNGIHQISGMLQIDRKIVKEFNLRFCPYGEVEEQATSSVDCQEVFRLDLER